MSSGFEIIIDDGRFEAVATFLPRDQVRDLIEDCVLAAARARVESSDPHEPARKLLEHTEERFRLRYIVGDLPAQPHAAPLEEFDDPVLAPDDNDGAIDDSQREQWAEALREHVTAIADLAAGVRRNVITAIERMTGLEVTRAIKALPTLHTTVILLTSNSRPADIAAGKEAGADLYLTKPFSPLELLMSVEQALDLA